MRKLCIAGLCLSVLLVQMEQGLAQLNRQSIKNDSKRVGSYRGAKSKFGKQKIYNAVGISVGALNYYGDLSPSPKKVSTDISFTKPAIGLSYTHRFGPRYSLQGQFMFGTLKGSDAESANKGDLSSGIYRYKRNLSFRNQIKELSVVAYFDLFDNPST